MNGYILFKLNYGALYKSEFVLRFSFDQNQNSEAYLNIIQQHAERSNLLHIEPAGDGQFLNLTYDIVLKTGVTAEQLTTLLGRIDGAEDVVLIASKNDVDY